jgi:hypothetical protein
LEIVRLELSSSRHPRGEAADALVQAYVACKIALDALPDLPADVREEAAQPLRDFCEVVGPALVKRFPELETEVGYNR